MIFTPLIGALCIGLVRLRLDLHCMVLLSERSRAE